MRLRLLALLFLFSESGGGQGLPPWLGDAPAAAEDARRSVVILERDTPIFVSPDTGAAKRGAAAKGARLPLFGAADGRGCPQGFFMVGAEAWVCGSSATPSRDAPLETTPEIRLEADGLPLPYYFVGPDGAFGYTELGSVDDSKPAREFEPGFAVAVSETAHKPGGDPFGLTTKGLWLPLRDLRRAIPAAFGGYEVHDGKLDRGWVVVDHAPVYAAPGGRRVAGASVAHFEIVPLLERADKFGHAFIRIGEGRWVDAPSVRAPSPSRPPPEARPGEHFIDVDRDGQVLTAYEGDTPVFAALVSTGVGKGADPTVTPLGTHRIWVKLRSTDMTNLEDEDALRYYAMEDVPWVMFFEKGYGLHGAFWHRSFGHVRSHGCVNLTPLDAKRLFDFANPRLPAGWTAVLPTEYDPGTLVRVR